MHLRARQSLGEQARMGVDEMGNPAHDRTDGTATPTAAPTVLQASLPSPWTSPAVVKACAADAHRLCPGVQPGSQMIRWPCTAVVECTCV